MTDPDSGMNAHDHAVVLRCQLGEAEAFDALARRWSKPLWSYCLRMTGNRDTAADLAQDIWLRVLAALPRLDHAARFRGWFFTIAHRTLMDRLRRSYATPPMADIAAMPDIAASADAAADDREPRLAELEAGLERLPVAERELLTLFYLERLPQSDIAAIAGVPLGTVKSRLFRARALLRDELSQQEVFS